MFNNYETYIERFVNAAQLNDYGYMGASAFTVMYRAPFRYDYHLRCRCQDKQFKELVFYNDSNKYAKLKNDSNVIEFMRMKTSFSMRDTLDNIKYFLMKENFVALVPTDYGLIRMTSVNGIIDGIDFYSSDKLTEDVEREVVAFLTQNLVVKVDHSTKKAPIKLVCWSGKGYYSIACDFAKPDCKVDENYNDDIPYERMKELLCSDKKELLLLHGEAGTGKTTLIKQLSVDIDKPFYFINSKMIRSISVSAFIEYLLTIPNSVLILEDCETLFADRTVGNDMMSTILNLTDGILGDIMKCKMICTFNCPLSKIDKALLRKGRLSLIYEFGKLCIEKTRLHLPSAAQPMTLADIYNTVSNGNDEKRKPIGFK